MNEWMNGVALPQVLDRDVHEPRTQRAALLAGGVLVVLHLCSSSGGDVVLAMMRR
jgi:hypothetical protein